MTRYRTFLDIYEAVPERRRYRIGSSGPLVRDLQVMLDFIVPVPPALALDGLFGPKTNARVVTFHRQAGLTADGIVGPQTSKALVGGVVSALGVGVVHQ